MTEQAIQQPTADNLRGMNILIEGEPGTGKTYSIASAIKAGIEVFYVDLENGVESILLAFEGEIPANFHYVQLEAQTSGFDELAKFAEDINRRVAVTDSNGRDKRPQTPDKSKTRWTTLIQLNRLLANFVDQNGESFGPVDSWGVDRMLVIDGLTELGAAAMQIVVGASLTPAQSEWYEAQQLLRVILKKLTYGCRCHFVLLAHTLDDVDEATKLRKTVLATIGKALIPQIPAMFGEVLLSKFDRNEGYVWKTKDNTAKLKSRKLHDKETVKQDFGTLWAKWKQIQG